MFTSMLVMLCLYEMVSLINKITCMNVGKLVKKPSKNVLKEKKTCVKKL